MPCNPVDSAFVMLNKSWKCLAAGIVRRCGQRGPGDGLVQGVDETIFRRSRVSLNVESR